MKPVWSHPWDLTPRQARQVQEEARGRVLLRDDAAALFPPARLVAFDVAYDRPLNLCVASMVLWDVAARHPAGGWSHAQPATFPYVPGLLTFREIPALLPLIELLEEPPPLVLCDGQGIAHPRRIGLASHLGLMLDCPTLGWAKSRLIGTYEEPAPEAGNATPLLDGAEQIGWALRSRARVRPTFVSPGHRVSLARALELARALIGPWRLCEPARWAHRLTADALAAARREAGA